jgi:LytS/YehU family sensor histidine kinase
MNPHFVFNAMNTLQNYILKNESENAIEYLAKFARLMRLFLESSRNKFH